MSSTYSKIAHPLFFSLIAGLLAATGFAPLDAWPVTLCALAGLFALLERAAAKKRAFAIGWWFGMGYFTLGNNWIAHAFTFQDAMPHWLGYLAVVALALYLAIYPGLATLCAWWLWTRLHGDRRGAGRVAALTLPLAFAGSWIVSEYLRATVFTGFAWNPLGVIWVPTDVALLSRVIGTYGLSGVAILTGAALAWAVQARSLPALAAFAGKLLLIFAGSYLLRVLHPHPPDTQVAIRVVQPNIGQQDKHNPAYELTNYRKLAGLSIDRQDRPRLIFWPEAAIPAFLDMEPDWRSRLAALLGPHDLLMTGGTKVYFDQKPKGIFVEQTLVGANNSLWVLTPDARLVGRYDKSHLVPYGEYLPMRPILSRIGLSRLVPGDADFWPGPGARTLTLPAASGRPTLNMGVQICYEIIFSGQVVDRAHRPDFLFNPSNDAWFGAWGPPQHLAQARLRAIEEGLPVIRSTPTGISAVVNANGGVEASLPHYKAGAIDAFLPMAHAPTFFALFGNAVPLALACLFFLLAIASERVRR